MCRARHPRATPCHASPDPDAFPVRLCGPVSTASGRLCARRPRHTKNAPPCACHSGHGRQKPSHRTLTQRPCRAHHRCCRTNQPTASSSNPHSFIGLRDSHAPPPRFPTSSFVRRPPFNHRQCGPRFTLGRASNNPLRQQKHLINGRRLFVRCGTPAVVDPTETPTLSPQLSPFRSLASSSSRPLASCRSLVSNPSVNQL